jgi:hypothetical protein
MKGETAEFFSWGSAVLFFKIATNWNFGIGYYLGFGILGWFSRKQIILL